MSHDHDGRDGRTAGPSTSFDMLLRPDGDDLPTLLPERLDRDLYGEGDYALVLRSDLGLTVPARPGPSPAAGPEPQSLPWPQSAAGTVLLALIALLSSGAVDPMLPWAR